ncbi:odorant receptor 46a-like isoform X1 [Daktulosphaira vitifoliae]|uniref:odorant receptor 46a-like isoform X1 n=1 Tax=Daktulosphaira vitifoliae TaxID=58002 RepID=UPI0021A9A8DC|nr:odorant receptor 46a-like isoform X1 [Daktulosphaira vitifoliae]
MCTKIIDIYTMIYFLGGILWIFSPLFIKEFTFKKRDGSLIIFQNNVLNSFFSFIPISVYDRIYPIVYLLEAIELLHMMYGLIFYNVIVVQFCWMLSAHLKIVAFKCKKFGQINVEFGQRNGFNYMINFKQLLLDYTKLNISIQQFYDIMKPTILFSFGYYFYAFIALTYMSILNYFNNERVLSINSMKLLSSTLILLISLFIMCYFNSYLENQINKVELAMYSIDWTDKNIKFKKMLLLTMSLNNTKRLKMNITPQKTLNLEVFASAMRVSYSIVSLLTKKTNFK